MIFRYHKTYGILLSNVYFPPLYTNLVTATIWCSLRYHLLHPDYLYFRIRELQKNFKLRVVLCHVDVVSPLTKESGFAGSNYILFTVFFLAYYVQCTDNYSNSFTFHMLLGYDFSFLPFFPRKMWLNLYLKSPRQLCFTTAPFCVLGGSYSCANWLILYLLFVMC